MVWYVWFRLRVYRVCRHFCRRRRQRATAPGAASRGPTLLQALTRGLYVSTTNLDSAERCLLRRNLSQFRSRIKYIWITRISYVYYFIICNCRFSNSSDSLVGRTLASYVGGPGFDFHRGAYISGSFLNYVQLNFLIITSGKGKRRNVTCTTKVQITLWRSMKSPNRIGSTC